MRAAKKDENGNIVDVETGEILVRNGESTSNINPPAILSGEEQKSVETAKNGVVGDSVSTVGTDCSKKSTAMPSSFKIEKTKYDVTPDTCFVIRFFLYEEDGIIRVADNNDGLSQAEPHWVKFRLWNYKEENTWRANCQEYSMESRGFIMNYNKFNEIKIRNLIRDWSFAEFDEKYHLLHVNGYLSDESYDLFCGLQPSIVFHIIRMMNSYLEA